MIVFIIMLAGGWAAVTWHNSNRDEAPENTGGANRTGTETTNMQTELARWGKPAGLSVSHNYHCFEPQQTLPPLK